MIITCSSARGLATSIFDECLQSCLYPGLKVTNLHAFLRQRFSHPRRSKKQAQLYSSIFAQEIYDQFVAHNFVSDRFFFRSVQLWSGLPHLKVVIRWEAAVVSKITSFMRDC